MERGLPFFRIVFTAPERRDGLIKSFIENRPDLFVFGSEIFLLLVPSGLQVSKFRDHILFFACGQGVQRRLGQLFKGLGFLRGVDGGDRIRRRWIVFLLRME